MLHLGQRVSEYVLEDCLGAGAFGEVWRARHNTWANRVVAIKIPTEIGYINNLRREGIALHELEHPNIVRAIGFDPYADPPYLVMEYVPGTNLRSHIDRGELSPDNAVCILGRILEALSYAHSRGVIHRDVKPENVLVHQDAEANGFGAPGMVCIADFGLGKAANAASAQSIQMSMSVASADARKLVGTLDYMSPEQKAGDEIDARTDLFACGVILFEMLTGRKPVGPKLPSQLNPMSPTRLDTVYARACDDVASRYLSAAQFIHALNTLNVSPHAEPKSSARIGNARNPDRDSEQMRPVSKPPIAASHPTERRVSRPAPEVSVGSSGGVIADLKMFTNDIGMRFVLIPPGEFLMGSPNEERGRNVSETQHDVRITTAYGLQTTEVTQRQWKAVMGNNPSAFKGDNLPVEMVSWSDAVAFCKTLSRMANKKYRLPTEEEWEYACRAGTAGAYAGIGNVGDLAWHRGNSDGATHEVAQKQANTWGLYDMHGNVWEWCAHWYREYPEGEVSAPIVSPTYRGMVVRGGSWKSDPMGCRSAVRSCDDYGSRGNSLGFRVVLDP